MIASTATANAIALALGLTTQAINCRAARAGISPIKKLGRNGGNLFDAMDLVAGPVMFSAAERARVMRSLEAQPAPKPIAAVPDPDQFDRRSDRAKKRAIERAEMLGETDELSASMGRTQADAIVAARHGFGAAQLRRWRKKATDRVAAEPASALLDRWIGNSKPRAACPDFYWQLWKADYLRREQPAARACYDRIVQRASAEGAKLPGYYYFIRRLKRELSWQAITFARKGADKFAATYPAQRRTRGHFHAMEAVNADGWRSRIYIKWPGVARPIKPVLLFWQDLYSGKMLAWRADQTENKDVIRLSYGDLLEIGVPSKVWLDNGRGFASKWLSGRTPNRYRFQIREEDPAGVITLTAEEIHYTTPYHGQSKPIERAFRDFRDRIEKHPRFSGAYAESHAIELEVYLAIVEQEIAAHNARPGRRSQVCNGRSFDAVFNESYAREPIRKATEEQRRLCLLAAENVTIQKRDGTFNLWGGRFWSEESAEYAGRTLTVRFDPDRINESPAYLYSLDGRYIGSAEAIADAPFNSVDAAREHARLRRQNLKAHKQALANENRMEVLEAAEYLQIGGGLKLTMDPQVAAKIVRPIRLALESPSETAAPPKTNRASVERIQRFAALARKNNELRRANGEF